MTENPAFTGIRSKCTQVAETPTESSPIQTGRGGWVLLELSGSRMLRSKKVMSPRKVLLTKSGGGMTGENETYKFVRCPHLNSKNLVVGNE